MAEIGAGSRPHEYVGIQYLRGLAAIMVMAFHLGHQLDRMGYAGPWPADLAAGTDLFFVISGFIMWATTRSPVRPAEFMERRILRIVPLYWIITSLMVAALVEAPRLLQSATFEPVHVLASYLFLPVVSPATGQLEPVLQPGWTLNYEMFFYLVFAAVLAAHPGVRFWGLVGTLLGLAVVGAVAAPPATSPAAFYTSSVLVEFAFGVVLARLVVETQVLRRVSVRCGGLLAFAAFAGVLAWPVVLPPDLPSRVALGASAALLIGGLLCVETRGALPQLGLMRLLGDASYSIYLSQALTLSAASQLWRRLHLDGVAGGWCGFVLFGLVAGTLGGVVVYLCVERPLARQLRSRRAHPPAPRLASSPAG